MHNKKQHLGKIDADFRVSPVDLLSILMVSRIVATGYDLSKGLSRHNNAGTNCLACSLREDHQMEVSFDRCALPVSKGPPAGN